MPALPRLTTSLLRDLASRLRYVPTEAARKQLVRAEELAKEVYEDVVTGPGRDRPYPGEWVLGRITGYEGGRVGGAGRGGGGAGRSASTELAIGEGEMIVGSALLADLGALVEHLSVAAKIGVAEEPAVSGAGLERGSGVGPANKSGFTIEELCARWGVSRKSIERWRREGLYARRAVGGAALRPSDGRKEPGLGRLIYAKDVVERFEKGKGLGVGGAASVAGSPRLSGPRRLAAEQRESMVRWAKRYHARLGWGVGQITERLAAKRGCSAETVRRVLREHEERMGESFLPRRVRLDRAARAMLTGAYGRGAPVRSLAAERGLSRASVYRLVWKQRLELLRGISGTEWGCVAPDDERGIRQITSPMFNRAEAEEVFLGIECVNRGPFGAWPRELAGLLREARAQSPVLVQEEMQCAAAYRYLLWRARREVKGLTEKFNGAGAQPVATVSQSRLGARVERVEMWLVWASRLKSAMTRSQLGLVVRTIEAAFEMPVEQVMEGGKLIEVAVQAAMEGVERFDPFQGGRLAAPVGLGVGRAVSRWMKEQGNRGQVLRGQGEGTMAGRAVPISHAGIAESGESELPAFEMMMHRWQGWIEPSEADRARVMGMGQDQPARRVMVARWGWGSESTSVAGVTRPLAVAARPRTAAEVATMLGMNVRTVRSLERRAMSLGDGAV